MDTENINVKIAATSTGLEAGLNQATQKVTAATNSILGQTSSLSSKATDHAAGVQGAFSKLDSGLGGVFKSIGGGLGMIGGALAAFAGAAAIGAFMGKAVVETVKWNTEAQRLARSLNISAGAASALNLAIGDVYGSGDQFIAMVQGMNRQLRTNEDGLKAMGLATRDVNGEYRDQQELVFDALKVLNEYKEGTDRNLAAQALFGKGVDVTNEMLKLNAEGLAAATEKANELNLTVSQEGVEATNAYRAAMNDAEDVVMGLMKAIGDALMPVFTELLQLFSDVGPTAILIVKGAIGGLAATFHGLSLAVKVIWELLIVFFKSVADYASAFGKMWDAIFSGDFDAAIAARDELWSNLKNNASSAFENIQKDAQETRDKLWNLFADGTPTMNVDEGDKSFKGKEDKKKDKDGAAEERKRLAEIKRLKDEEFRMFVEEKDMELEKTRETYADQLRIAMDIQQKAKDLYGENSSEYRKASLEILRIKKEEAQEISRIQAVQKQAALDASLDRIEYERQEADYMVNSKQISLQERLEMEKNFEEESFNLRMKALEEKLLGMDIETEAYAKMLAQIEELKRQHELNMANIANEGALMQKAPFDEMMTSMRQGWGEIAANVLTGQMSLKEGLNAVWKMMLTNFIKMLGQKLAASKLFASLEIAVGKMISAVLRVLGIQSATQAISTKSSETMGKIGQSAASAGAGAAESQASIPYIGPILAIAAMAAIFAAVMGMKSKAGGGSTPSAMNGYDIPAGVNPLTQLHEREMVLPQEQADTIRNMKEGSGATHLHVHALDSNDVAGFFHRHKKSIAESVKSAERSGMFKK